jgi:hypothetical protein
MDKDTKDILEAVNFIKDHMVTKAEFVESVEKIENRLTAAFADELLDMALNLIRRARGKDSLRLRRKVAAWDDDFLASLILSNTR